MKCYETLIALKYFLCVIIYNYFIVDYLAFECHQWINQALNSFSVLYFIGFGLCLFLLYNLVPVAIKFSSATVVNLSLLTADFYSLLCGLFLFHYKVSHLSLSIHLTDLPHRLWIIPEHKPGKGCRGFDKLECINEGGRGSKNILFPMLQTHYMLHPHFILNCWVMT